MMDMSAERVQAFNQSVIKEFRANEGICRGHFEGNPLVLLTTTGAKSGVERTAPLSYYALGDDLIVMASAAGSPNHPAWYHNLVANPEVTVEVGADRFTTTVVVLSGAERDEAIAAMVGAIPRFGDYLEATDREIPVLKLPRPTA